MILQKPQGTPSKQAFQGKGQNPPIPGVQQSAGYAGPQSSSLGLRDPRLTMDRPMMAARPELGPRGVGGPVMPMRQGMGPSGLVQTPQNQWSAFAAGQGPRPRGMVPLGMSGAFGPQSGMLQRAQAIRSAQPPQYTGSGGDGYGA